ncbi:MAG: hypothetical protein RLZZ631_1094 [Cyanobacteriota bacterium]
MSWLRKQRIRIHAAAGDDPHLLEVLAWAAVMASMDEKGQLPQNRDTIQSGAGVCASAPPAMASLSEGAPSD